MMIDDLMPDYDVHEIHSIMVRAPKDRAWIAVKSITPAQLPLLPVLRALATIRSLPARLSGRQGLWLHETRPLLQRSKAFAVLAERPESEIVLGTINQFWRLRGGRAQAIQSAREFLAFDTPGYAKAVLNFSLTPEPAGLGTMVTTETRVLSNDSSARRRFAIYWFFIHPGSALIRRAWLIGIKRLAEQPPVAPS